MIVAEADYTSSSTPVLRIYSDAQQQDGDDPALIYLHVTATYVTANDTHKDRNVFVAVRVSDVELLQYAIQDALERRAATGGQAASQGVRAPDPGADRSAAPERPRKRRSRS